MANVPILGPNQAERARARRREILADVGETLFRAPRELSPKYFYDARGSELFEEITRLPEYYLTRSEREILLARAGDIVDAHQPRTLVELGAGSAAKTRILLDAMTQRDPHVTYVPVDVSEEFLEATARALEAEYPSLRVDSVVADISTALDVPSIAGPVLFAFLGSTIGNFAVEDAVALLRRVRARMKAPDRLLLGTDLRKSESIVNAAYNDARGITAEFNRNMLRVLNTELGADFVPEQFAHHAFYNGIDHRVEMHLSSMGDQVVRLPGLPTLILRDGECIRTELSHKYDRESVEAMLASARLRIEQWYTDTAGRFALSVVEPMA